MFPIFWLKRGLTSEIFNSLAKLFFQRRRRDIFVETQTKNSPAPSGRHLFFENSPALQRWDNRSNKPSQSRQGRQVFVDDHLSFVPDGTFYFSRAKPSLERLGYFLIHWGGIIGCSGAVSGRGVSAVVGHKPPLQDFPFEIRDLLMFRVNRLSYSSYFIPDNIFFILGCFYLHTFIGYFIYGLCNNSIVKIHICID